MLTGLLIFIACFLSILAGILILERWLRRRMERRSCGDMNQED